MYRIKIADKNHIETLKNIFMCDRFVIQFQFDFFR